MKQLMGYVKTDAELERQNRIFLTNLEKFIEEQTARPDSGD